MEATMMSPVVMKMLADAHLADISRQVELERKGDRRSRTSLKLPAPLALVTLILAAILGSGLLV